MQSLWIVDIYGFLVASALITMANLADQEQPPAVTADKLRMMRAVIHEQAAT